MAGGRAGKVKPPGERRSGRPSSALPEEKKLLMQNEWAFVWEEGRRADPPLPETWTIPFLDDILLVYPPALIYTRLTHGYTLPCPVPTVHVRCYQAETSQRVRNSDREMVAGNKLKP